MKKMILTLTMILSSSAALASELYLVEPMNCTGQIYGRTSGVHPDYTQLALTFNSARSMRRDQTLANSLEVSDNYFGPNETVEFKHEAGAGGWYMGPLFIEGNNVFRKSLSGRDDDLNLKIVKSTVRKGVRYDQLQGTWFEKNSVAGPHGYKLTCVAKVVDEAKLVIDMTTSK